MLTVVMEVEVDVVVLEGVARVVDEVELEDVVVEIVDEEVEVDVVEVLDGRTNAVWPLFFAFIVATWTKPVGAVQVSVQYPSQIYPLKGYPTGAPERISPEGSFVKFTLTD